MTRYVLIPGLLSDGTVWTSVAAALGECAEIADLTKAATIEDMAASLLDGRAEDFVAIGHSMGGRVAMEMARQAPDRLRGLILLSTGHHGWTTAEMPKREARIAMGHDSMEALADDWLPPMVAPSRRDDGQLMGDLRDMVLRFDAATHERQVRALIARPDAASYLPQITAPVLLLVGEEDGWSPPEQHREIAQMVQDATLKIVADAGHFLPVEKPGETAAAMTEWLNAKGLSYG